MVLIACPTFAPAATPTAQLVRTLSPTSVSRNTDSPDATDARAAHAIPSGTLLTVVQTDPGVSPPAAGAPPRVFIKSVSVRPQYVGWIDPAQLEPLQPPGTNLESSPLPLGSADSLQRPPAPPTIIQLQSPELQLAWSEIQAAIADNEKLPKPLPEPYFARAEILAMVHDFDAALRDYLRAVQIASDAHEDLATYTAYFTRLREALEGYDRSPRPPATGLASMHYAAGVHAYRRADYQSAIGHFSDAIALDEHKPLYWYYRAAAHHQSSAMQRATHDALVGAHLEWRNGTADRIGNRLLSVQGPTRTWLESVRLGKPSQQLVQSTPSR
jgi:hypothetical protein